ncbi:hypothetical protein BDF19DRAFT_439726 [Syncephalis fuscata]|nr:hypothetical protein BDF19DRAFT_439726 [Syncephalis fuscata]
MRRRAVIEETEEEEEEDEDDAMIVDIFEQCDKDEDNLLSMKELESALILLDVPKNKRLKMIEQQKKQVVDYEEFHRLVESLQEVTGSHPEVERLFRLLDCDEKGYISYRDIQRLSVELGEKYSKSDIEDMLQVANDSHSNNVSHGQEDRLTVTAFEKILKRLGFI